MTGRILIAGVLAGCSFHPGAAIDATSQPLIDRPPDQPAIPADALVATGCFASWLTHTVQVDPPALVAELAGSGYDRDVYVAADEKTLWWVCDRGPLISSSGCQLASPSSVSWPAVSSPRVR